jgi:6,7-dimethyl-8-ribityllumazine synthase
MTSGGFWPGEPPAAEQEDVPEAVPPPPTEPPGWPSPRHEQAAQLVGDAPTAEPEPEPEPEQEPEQEPEPEPQPAAVEGTVQKPAVAPPLETEPEPEVVPEPAAQPAAGEAEEDGEPERQAEPAVAVHAPGELEIPDGVAVLEGSPSGAERTVGVVVSRFNGEVSDRLLASALEALGAAGVPDERITVMPVPGAFELPLGAMALAKTRRYSCVVALGCVNRGETSHFDYVAGEAASGLQLAGIETGVPVAFGVLTVDTAEQAEARTEKGAEAARAALEMADLFSQLRAHAKG